MTFPRTPALNPTASRMTPEDGKGFSVRGSTTVGNTSRPADFIGFVSLPWNFCVFAR